MTIQWLVIAVAFAGQLPADSPDSAAFSLSFDAGLQSNHDRSPALAQGVLLAAGQKGQAALFPKGALLAFPTQGNYDSKRGTLDLWVRPNWDSSEPSSDRFFWGVDSDPRSENRTVLGFLGRNGKGTVYFGGDGALGGLAAPVDWRAGEWHRLTVWWDEAQRCRALYIDGVRRHAIQTSARMPSQTDKFHVGSLPCVTRWDGVLAGHEAEAFIDEVRLTPTVDAPDHGDVIRMAVADIHAQKAYEQSREAARPAYEAAWKRLRESITLQGVADNRIEAQWDDLVGMAAPLTQRVPLQARYHPELVFLNPDLSIALGRENESLGIGFALGSPFRLPDTYRVTRKLHRGYQPIVESEWASGPCVLRQTALALLPHDDETVSGTETQYVVVRLSVQNASADDQRFPLVLTTGRMGGSQNTNYAPFIGSASRWMAPSLGITHESDALMVGDKVFLTYRTDAPVPAVFHERFATGTADPALPESLTNCLAFDLDLKAGETRTFDFVVAGASALYPAGERTAMQALTYDEALARAEAYWDRPLATGMKLTTPEPRLNDIYRHLILSCLGNFSKNPNRPWHEPNQTPIWEGVWPWEWSAMAVPLCALGYDRELEPSFRFFTERQTGRGPYADPNRGPEGEIKCTYGCYTGNFLLRWMSETGSVLSAMAAKYQYSRDTAWLMANRDSILAACDWIQGERARTRRFNDSGEKVDYYGLLPRGRVHDWNDWHYFLGFSDTYSWKGMADVAAAFRDAGLPEAGRLTDDAAEYRQCILDAVDRIQFTDPETGLLFVPNLVPTQEGEQGGLWWADGPSPLFFTGMLDPRTDPRYEPMVEYLQRKWGTLLGLMNRMDEPRELGADNPYWYVNSTERGYFQACLARGETEKALLIFYSNLVYGLSHDCYQTVERIHVSNPNYAPFQPNASGNGRMLDMFRRMVIDEQDPGVLWLLRGCPRRWFEPGQSVVVQDAPTCFGKMGLRTESTGNSITVDIDAPDRQAPAEIRVVFRHPSGRLPAKAFVNGQEAPAPDGVVTVPSPTGRLQVRCEYPD